MVSFEQVLLTFKLFMSTSTFLFARCYITLYAISILSIDKYSTYITLDSIGNGITSDYSDLFGGEDYIILHACAQISRIIPIIGYHAIKIQLGINVLHNSIWKIEF